MKREILFRAKYKNTWVYGNLIQCENHSGESFFQIDNGKMYDHQVYEIDHTETVGQFTGLTDKNGNKIFEGDVISGDKFKHKLVIGFNNESSAFCASKTNNFETKNCYWFHNDIVLVDGWSVTGNIHEK